MRFEMNFFTLYALYKLKLYYSISQPVVRVETIRMFKTTSFLQCLKCRVARWYRIFFFNWQEINLLIHPYFVFESIIPTHSTLKLKNVFITSISLSKKIDFVNLHHTFIFNSFLGVWLSACTTCFAGNFHPFCMNEYQ